MHTTRYTTQVTARMPIDLVEAIDATAAELGRSRADVIRIAVNKYFADYVDLRLSVSALQDHEDQSFDWEVVRARLLRRNSR